MNNSTWQHPFVNIFKHFDIGSTKKCAKQGDVTALMVPKKSFVSIKKKVFSFKLGS